jgi:putative Mn2+ efflux pump MntP
MRTLEIFFIALGLSMDCFAVAIASGFAIRGLRMRHAFTISFSFGAFQAAMPLIGWLTGRSFSSQIINVDHWLAFALLVFIGSKMMYESFTMKKLEEDPSPLHLRRLLLLSMATSIDALAVGLSLSLLNTSIAAPALMIGAVAFILSFVGVYIGNYMGASFENKLEAFGGVILIGIGVKILIEHLAG